MFNKIILYVVTYTVYGQAKLSLRIIVSNAEKKHVLREKMTHLAITCKTVPQLHYHVTVTKV